MATDVRTGVRKAGGRTTPRPERREEEGGSKVTARRGLPRHFFFPYSRCNLAEGMLDARGRRAPTTAGTGLGLGFAARGAMHRHLRGLDNEEPLEG